MILFLLGGCEYQMNREEENHDRVNVGERQPHRVRLPGFIGDEEIGLGDVIKRVTYTVGIKPCGSCEQRAAMLNRWMVITGRHRR